MSEIKLSLQDLMVRWQELSTEERPDFFQKIPREEAEELFLNLHPLDQAQLILKLPVNERQWWLRFLPIDDSADLLQRMSHHQREESLLLLDEHSRREVMGILAYAEDSAGGVMDPHYIRLRPEMSVEEAISYMRAQAKSRVEVIYYAYVLNHAQKLLGVISFRQLLLSPPASSIQDIMRQDFVSVYDDMTSEEAGRKFARYHFLALPVIDREGVMVGILTHDDVTYTLVEQATEDFQKLGGTESLDEPYMEIGFINMMKKRGGWLSVLFLGEMLTATAMGFFEKQIEAAVVLSLFIPLIISSGGNAGSQAATLIIRAMALQEIQLKDWFRVFIREFGSGLCLGLFLGLLGFLRILLWPHQSTTYGSHYVLIGFTVGVSVTCVVLWGTLVGALLPLFLRRVGFDPAAASVPFVATLVDVTGLVIYFSTAILLLKGVLL